MTVGVCVLCSISSCSRRSSVASLSASEVLKVRVDFSKPPETANPDTPIDQAVEKTLHRLETDPSDRHSLKIYQALQNMLNLLEGDSTCADFLGGIDVVKTEVGKLAKYNLVGHSKFDSRLAAFVGIGGTDLEDGSAVLVINRAAAFFRPGTYVSGLPGNTARVRLHILLHEMAHILGAKGFKSDYGSAQAVAANDKMIASKCAASLGSLAQ